MENPDQSAFPLHLFVIIFPFIFITKKHKVDNGRGVFSINVNVLFYCTEKDANYLFTK